MDSYEANRIYFAPQNLSMEDEKTSSMTNEEKRKIFVKFIKEFQLGNVFVYREQLKANFMKKLYFLEFNFEDINSFDTNLADQLYFKPGDSVPHFEKAIQEVCFELSSDFRSIEQVPQFQFQLVMNSNPKNLRELESSNVNQLVVVSGIIVMSSKPNIRGSKLCVQCKNCGNTKYITVDGINQHVNIPRTCDSTKLPLENKEKCPLDSYQIISENTEYVDHQSLKLQEPPEMIPTGDIPRSYNLVCEKYLVSKVTPGTRVIVVGVLAISSRTTKENIDQVKSSVIRVLGFQSEQNKLGKYSFNFTQEEEHKIINMAKDPKIYDKICKSIAPAIFGNDDIKRAIACLLFGGCRKRLSEGVNLRGDINILLLGDPSTAKSQFLKFAERVAPIAVYTSGKGSSAAGLTASIIRDPSSGEFQLEGGAMVLADGGIVCIDEFDKMRAQDRVAIHEAMEQQTISVAKAGITTTLNSRTSVLAAANPIYGRLDDLKATQDQIDFQTTILSRFDCIFLVKDIREMNKDMNLAHHIMDLHITGKISDRDDSEIPLADLKRFIAYARMKGIPKISPEAGHLLQNYYVEDRKAVNENKKAKRKNNIPVTVRQLEAIIRLSEAIAKMNLSNFVLESHVNEGHRLFQISTLSAASAKFNTVTDIPADMAPLIVRIEESIRRRLNIGAKTSYTKIIEELTHKYSSHKAITYAVINMIRRDELAFLESRKIIQRKK